MTLSSDALPLWPETSYIRPIENTLGGIRAYTHLADLRPPQGSACRGYVKHFPETHGKGLFNEWFGYIIMRALGVPQPPAAIMLAPVFALPGGPLAWAFVSCQPRPVFEGTPSQIYQLQNPAHHAQLKRRLFACPALPLLIAADQLLKNADRHLGNLVFTGRDQFVAIDHSDILGGPDWRYADTHFSQKWAVSRLIEEFETLTTLPEQARSAILAKAEAISAAYFAGQSALALTLGSVVQSDVRAAMDMVWWRALALCDWFKDKLQLVV